MSNVTDKTCEIRRGDIYDSISKRTPRWFTVISVTVLLGMAGKVMLVSGAQGDNAGNIKVNARTIQAQKELAEIGRKHREAWRKEVIEKLDRLAEKQDIAIEKFLTHKHE